MFKIKRLWQKLNIKDDFGIDSSLIKEPLDRLERVKIRKSEQQWLEIQAELECTSKNSILRKSLKFYKESIQPKK